MSNKAQPQPRICPIFTAGFLARPEEKSSIVGLGAQKKEPEAVPCAGPLCMWYKPIADENGKVVGADCVASLLPMALGQIAASLNELKKT